MGIFDSLKNRGNKPQETTSAAVPSVVDNPKKILIVEDEQMLIQALSIKFQNEGYKVITAANGQAGLEMAVSQKPDLIILDLIMPIMDGKTMLKKLRDMPEFALLPVIVLTNNGNLDNIVDIQSLYNVSAFLLKANISTDELIFKVKEALSPKLGPSIIPTK